MACDMTPWRRRIDMQHCLLIVTACMLVLSHLASLCVGDLSSLTDGKLRTDLMCLFVPSSLCSTLSASRCLVWVLGWLDVFVSCLPFLPLCASRTVLTRLSRILASAKCMYVCL